MIVPDPVPLGVSGSVTIPREKYRAHVAGKAGSEIVLVNDRQRIEYLVRRLNGTLDRPLTAPGSEGLARMVLSHFENVDLLPHFAEKALETLRDGKRHDRIGVSPNDPRFAVWFVAWNGTHREVQSERYGEYFDRLAGIGRTLVRGDIAIAGLLEIDAYVRDNADLSQPGRSLDDVFEIDIEYSYLPGFSFDSSAEAPDQLSKALILNLDLCTPEQKRMLKKLMAPPG